MNFLRSNCFLLFFIYLSSRTECKLIQNDELDVWYFFRDNPHPNASIEINGDLLYHFYKDDINPINKVKCKGFFDFFEVDYTCSTNDLLQTDNFTATYTIKCNDKIYRNKNCYVQIYLEAKDLLNQLSNQLNYTQISFMKSSINLVSVLLIGQFIVVLVLTPCIYLMLKYFKK